MNTNNKPLTAYGSNKDEEEIHKKYARLSPDTIVEIGVLEGYTSQILLANSPETCKVIGVDPIIPDSMNEALVGNLAKIKEIERHNSKYDFFHDYSYSVVDKFMNETLDYLFIDGSHRHGEVVMDFEDWLPKVKIGGYIGLHDSCMHLQGGAQFWHGPSELCQALLKESETRVNFVEACHALSIFQRIK